MGKDVPYHRARRRQRPHFQAILERLIDEIVDSMRYNLQTGIRGEMYIKSEGRDDKTHFSLVVLTNLIDIQSPISPKVRQH